jgi:aldehyde dehydrogenase (NAD+)
LAQEVGFPPGVINVVTGYGQTAGAALSTHPGLDKLSFTGGTATGRRVAQAAGANTTPLTLELGGKSPHLVFADADLARVTNGVLAGIFAACGQSCVAGSRLLAHESVVSELTDRITNRAKSIVIGDPSDPASEMGPLAFAEQLDRCEHYVRLGTEEGANLLLGGRQPATRQGRGYFFEPTIFGDVRNGMRIAQEEIFGPVLCITPFTNEAEAVAMANDSPYGLAAGVWTQDIGRAHRVAHQLQAGTIWINAYRIVSHASPMGGYKSSGYGRENGIQAINDYTTLKSVWIDLSDVSPDPFSLRV